jgi:ElaB/YqjD/DUF883 family membrane-anchored ribosome-binding protein
MPLKEPDLKDTDTYKKASRLDLSKVAAGNAKFWIYKDVELPNSSGKKQKYPAFLALVDDNGIRKAMTGKKLLCKGLCGMKDEKIAFEPTTGKVPYKLLKPSLPLLLGKAVWIPTGMEEEGDEEEAMEAAAPGGAPNALIPVPPAPPAAPPPPGADLTATWSTLLRDTQAAAGSNPARKEALARAAAGIPELIKANNIKEATARMAALRAMIDAPAPPPPPPAPPSAPPPASPQAAGANLMATWSNLMKEAQAAVAANPARRDALSHAAAGIPDLIKTNAAEAKKRMDALAAMLAAKPAPAQPDAAALTSRWNNLVKLMQAEVAAHPDKKPVISRAAAGIPDTIKAGKLDEAAKLMDGIDQLLHSTGPAAASAAGDAPYKGIVAYRKSLLEFDQAKKTVASQLQALGKAMEAHSPGLSELAAAVEEQLGELNDQIQDAIDAAMTASENQASPITDAIKTNLQKYLTEVASSQLVQRADSNPFGVNVTIQKTLSAALQNIRQSLPVRG